MNVTIGTYYISGHADDGRTCGAPGGGCGRRLHSAVDGDCSCAPVRGKGGPARGASGLASSVDIGTEEKHSQRFSERSALKTTINGVECCTIDLTKETNRRKERNGKRVFSGGLVQPAEPGDHDGVLRPIFLR